MKMFVCALLAGAMVLFCPLTSAHAESSAQHEDENAAAIVFRTMENDLQRCFVGINGNAFVLVDALVDPRGRVRRVEATGDARVGPATRRCVERRVARALFPAPRGGGLSRVRTSFVFALE